MTTEDLTKLTNMRANLKGRITRIENYVKMVRADVTELDKQQLKVRDEDVSSLFEKYNDVQCEIEAIQKAEEPDERTAIEEKYYQVKAAIATLMDGSRNKRQDFKKPPIAVPTLQIPNFDGDVKSWPIFKNLFYSVIHNNEELPNLQKLHYLKSFLTGEAAALLSSLILSEDNYEKALDILTKRYDNKLLVINHHLKSFMNFNFINKSNIKDFLTLFQQSFDSLKSLGLPIEHWDVLLIYIIVQKLDNSLRAAWEISRQSSEIPKLSELIDFLSHRSIAQELINDKFDKPNVQKYSSNTAKVSHATTSNKAGCILCDSKHELIKCPLFLQLSIPQRITFVKSKKLCYNCLSIYKAGHQCAQVCSKCHKKHNSALHLEYTKYNNTDDLSYNSSQPQTSTRCQQAPTTSSNVLTCVNNQQNVQHSCTQHHGSSTSEQERFTTTTNKGNSSCQQTQPIFSQQTSQTNSDCVQTNNSNNQLLSTDTQQLCTHTTTNKQVNSTIDSTKHVLLSTVQLKIKDSQGNWHVAKALLDSASEINFITNDLANRLCLPLITCNVTAVGIGKEAKPCQNSINTTIASRSGDYNTSVNLLLVDTITVPLPHFKLDISKWNMPKKCKLADPTFHTPSNIDMLLGTELFFSLMKDGYVKLGKSLPDLKNTVFGWIVTGSFKSEQVSLPIAKVSLKVTDISFELSNFWKIEEVSYQKQTTPEDVYCETLFKNTTVKDPSGQYIVNLPVNEEKVCHLGNSHDIALKRFYQLESRFRKNPTLKQLYREFISEYVSLGHARFVDDYNVQSANKFDINNPKIHLPHHAVIRPQSVSTKLRVVFDGSAATDTGTSLNDILYEGPNIYPEIIDILTRFRAYKFVFTSDIVKMFRCLLINENQRDLQRILWRDSESEPVQCLQLQTVTYGTKCAPYLAYRTLQHLADTEMENFPLASHPIKFQTFMDDICYGQNSENELKQVISQLIEMLQSASFSLHKWSSNVPHLLKDMNLDPLDQEIVGILGLKWNNNKDCFSIPIDVNYPEKLTKRCILSFIAKTFDPLGLLSACTVIGKIFIQEIWKENLDWDEPLTQPLIQKWNQIYDTWCQLSDINIPRYLFSDIPSECILVGFADASSKAYGGCIYILARYPNMKSTCNLVITKNKLAPIPTKTIPKLELNATLLLSQLLAKALKIFDPIMKIKEYHLFTDSSIVYHWLQSPYKKWNTFVSNRLTQILENTHVSCWNHVVTTDNPADLLTRGIKPTDLKKSSLWWHGPQWLLLPRSEWPQSKFIAPECDILNSKNSIEKAVNTVTEKGKSNGCDIFEIVFNRFSSFTKLQRTIAFCFRFFHNYKNKNDQRFGPLSFDELQKSHNFIIKNVQCDRFPKEVKELKSVDSTTDTSKLFTFKSSSLRKLSPYMDSDGLLRVGGRIKHANVQFNQKHPLILPCKHHITTLIIRRLHITLFHSGIQNTLANIRLNYWPIHGRVEVRKVIHNCVICIRYRAASCQQRMSLLPQPRVQLQRPFLHVGVDFSGAILVKCSTLRRATYSKGYICLFICLATKAIHLELVNDLTTQSFIMALKRLISRRGICDTIYSDNATNFHGAHNELNALYKMFKNKDSYNDIIDFASQQSIKWCFTVPLASHMGGIYEAGIKSAKNLLKRKLGNLKMHYEHLNTILIQIEGILNSRPLCALSDMPNDLTCLTPAHFLIGNPIVDIPEPSLLNVQDSRLNKYQLICKIKQQFWDQWYKQYLSELQNRAKWFKTNKNIEVSDLVILKEDNVPPAYWSLARVLKVFKSSADNLVRSVLLKTSNGEYHRPISKIILLPLNI